MGTESSQGRDGTATASTSGRNAAGGTNDKQDSQFHSLFDELDADHSGKIEPAELRVCLTSQTCLSIAISLQTSRHQRSKDDKVKASSFGAAQKLRPCRLPCSPRKVYHSLDHALPKHVHLYNLAKVNLKCHTQDALQRLGLPHNSDNYLKALMDQFDTDHDDKVIFMVQRAFKEYLVALSSKVIMLFLWLCGCLCSDFNSSI